MRWKDYRDKILSTIDTEAFYTEELKKLGLTTSRHGSELKSKCPFTERHTSGRDDNPSFTVNITKGVYFCNACGSKGNVHTFYSQIYKTSKQDTWFILGDALNIERPTSVDSRPDIDPGLPIVWAKNLAECNNVAKEMLFKKREVTEQTIKRFMLGWDGERVTIPVYDEFSELVNVRRYMWNSKEDHYKMISYVDALGNDYGAARIYGIEHLYDDSIKKIVWCEGEFDRIVAEQNGIKACTSTAGANSFRIEWLALLKRKEEVWICYDNDNAGKLATAYLIENLRGHVKLYCVNWPEGFIEKGDITDIFVKYKYTAEQFLALFKPLADTEDIPVVPLAASSNAKYASRRIKIPVLVAGKEGAPYIFPASTTITCTEGDPENKMCNTCSLVNRKEAQLHLISKEVTILQTVDCSISDQMAIIKSRVGCNPKCNKATIDVKTHENLEAIHMIPKADANFGFALRQEYVARSGYIIGNNLPTNKRYMLSGFMHANPKNQLATYIFDEAIPEKDMLDELEVTPEVHERLKTFQCKENQSVMDKFDEIHTDLERNVTYIWDRRKVAFAVDLIYHSAIGFTFQEQQVKRGWCECLIIGDSGQAKTTIVERLMAHYRCGELLSGESTRRTGLVYSLQQSGSNGHWSLMWGAMPLNDGGLLTVDELSGMSEDDLAKMSDVRSSGIAKSTGVVTAETTARTRIIFISNPRNGRQLKAENYGVSAILKLFGKAEDVRRLDFAIGVASGEVDSSVVNRSISEMPPIPNVYTSDLCKLRVQWAWSRHPDQIVFTPEATQTILEHAGRMGRKYTSRIPLVEPADQRIKLARLSVAAAASVYSTDDGTNVIVKKEHVEFVADYLNSIYDSRALSYDRFSADDFENSDTTDSALIALRKTFLGISFGDRDEMEIIKAIYQTPYFNRNSLEDATGLDRDELKDLLQFLISSSIVERTGTDYKRTPLGLAFIEYMLMNVPAKGEVETIRRERYRRSEV